MTPILLQDISKRFGPTLAVDRVSLRIEPGELFFLLGPSGCGKTTLLRMLAGFVQPDTGDIFFGDQCITRTPPRLRDAGMVFQTYALWPHMTVAKNVAYGLQVRSKRRAEINTRVEQALKLMRLEGLADRRPHQLSGGQQQRVALARALVVEPRVLLLDEPLSNLDARLRDELREEIRRLHQELGLTMVYVTHDQKEALALADRLAVMDRGRLMQVGTPTEVYHHPTHRFVAGFLGDCNFLPGELREAKDGQCTVETALGSLVGIPSNRCPSVGSKVLCSIRPQALLLDSSVGTINQIAGTVEHLTFLGEVVQLRVQAHGGLALLVLSLPRLVGSLQPGASVNLTVQPDQVMILEESIGVHHRGTEDTEKRKQ